MSIKSFIVSVIFSAIMSLAALIMILVSFSPASASAGWMVLFYIIFFLFAVSLFLLLGLAGRKLVIGRRLSIGDFMSAFRQGALFSTALTGCLLLQSFRLLSWWNALLLVGAVVFLEFCFLLC